MHEIQASEGEKFEGYYQQNVASTDDEESMDAPGLDKCNLIVNYLPHKIDDETLQTIFAEHGDISASKIIKDKLTKKSLGFGFVKYFREEDALAAIKGKNGFMLGLKKLKVSFARPSSVEIRDCKLYVTNIPRAYTEKDVHELFNQFGQIIECRVLKCHSIQSNKGVAFVQFDLKSQAENALSLNNYQPPGSDRYLIVKYANDQHKKKDRKGQMPAGMAGLPMSEFNKQLKLDEIHMNSSPYYRSMMPPPNMYRNQQLSMGMNQNDQYGQSSPGYPQRDNNKYRDSEGGGNNMYGMYGQMPQVGYQNQMLNNHNQGGHLQDQNGYDQRQLNQYMMNQAQSQQISNNQQQSAYLYQKSSQENKSITVIIDNLPQNADVPLLYEIFSPYGRIVTARMDVVQPEGSRGRSMVRGKVQMVRMQDAQEAVRALDNAVLFSGERPLQVKIAYEGGGGNNSPQQNGGH